MNNPIKTIGLAVVFTAAITTSQIAGAATTFLWNVATPGANNWNVNANWTPNTGNPGVTDAAIFGNIGTSSSATTVNNVVSVNTPVSSLQYTNATTSGTTYHVTQIPANVTLSVANNLTVTGLGNVDLLTTYAAMTGPGTLSVTAPTFIVGNNAATTGNALATLDLSTLSNFVYNASAATMLIGWNQNRSRGTLILAASSNSITAGTLSLGIGGSSNGGQNNLNLGGGTNIINANTINVIAQKANGSLQFSGGSGGSGGLRIRGAGGTDSDRATMVVGNRNATGSGTTTGNISLNGHPVDVKLGTLTLGLETANAAGLAGVGNFLFDTGTVTATNINMAVCSGNATATARGTLTIGGGALSVANNISLVNQTLGANSIGNLIVNGGSVVCSGNIIKTTSAGTGAITNANASLTVGGTIGSAATPIDNFTFANATLTLPARNSSASAFVTALNFNGSADTLNVSSLPAIGVFPTQLPLISYSTLNGVFDMTLGTLPPGYQGYVSNNVTTSSVDLVVTNGVSKSDVWTGTPSGNWDTSTTNWISSGSPTNYQQADSVTFDDTLTGTPNVNLTLTLLPGAVSCNNSAANYVFGGAGKISGGANLTKLGSGSLTLAETGGDDFNGGIIVNNGTLILDNTNSAISGGLTINGGTAQIGNNDGNGGLPSGDVTDNGALVFSRSNNVTVSTAISGSGTLTQSGSGKLTLSATNTYTGNTTAGSGTLALSGSGTISSSAQVSVNSATFDVSALSQPTTVSSLSLVDSTNTVALNASASARISTTSLTAGGTSNYINVTSFPAISSYPVTFTVIQSAGAIAGMFNFDVGSLPAATPPYAANVTQSGDLTAVLLTFTSGPTGVRSSVLWTGGDVPNLNTNWSDRLNWQLPDAPTGPEAVFFNSVGAQTVSALSTAGGGSSALIFDNLNNIVDANFTVGSLTFTNLGGTYHNTLIKDGLTLSVTNSGSLTVGSSASAFGAASTEFVTISGPNSTLSVSHTNGTLYVGLGDSTSGGHQATLDMSALGTFSATVSRFLVGVGSSSLGIPTQRESGNVYLAQTNTIMAGLTISGTETSDTSASAVAFGIGDNDGNGGSTSHLYLGQTNAIFADAIVISRQKQSAQMFFNPVFTSPSAYFRGRNGTSPVTIWGVGDGVANGGTVNATGIADLTGGTVNARVGTMYVGRSPNDTGGTGTVNGTMAFDAGTFNVGTIFLGYQPAAGSKIGRGTINVNTNATLGANAKLIVSGNLNIGFTGGGSGAAGTTGTLNITNGAVLANNIVVGTNSVTAINLIGGRLAVTNSIGSSGGPLGALTLAPLGTSDNSSNLLQLAASPTPSVTVSALNLDGLDTTTNVINISSIARPISPPVELPLIQYTTMTLLSGSTFNIGLGTLPAGYSGYLTNDTANSLVGLVITDAPVANPPVITSFTLQSGTNAVFNGTNGLANAIYYVLSSPAVDIPLSTWTRIATNSFDGSGNFSFTNIIDPTQPQRFFALQVP